MSILTAPIHRMLSPAADPEAFVRQHQVALWRYLRALGAPTDLAEDILQDTFVIACRKLHDDRGAAAAAEFLRQTARHLLLRRRRDQSRREAVLLELADRAWRDDCATDHGEAWLAALRACVEQLDGRSAAVVQAVYGEGAARRDAAGRLGMKETGVKTLLQRVRTNLRACVERRMRSEP